MSISIAGGAGKNIPLGRTNGPKARLKTTEVAAEATGLPQETFKPTKNPLKAGLLQGKMAKKLGGKAGDVSVTDYGLTFTGKALDNLRETALNMAGKTAEGAGAPLWADGNIKQLHISVFDTPKGVQEMDHPSGIITSPDKKAGAATQLGYLFAKS